MTQDQARTVRIGDEVAYRGRRYTVASVSLRGIATPHFRLTPLGDHPGEDLTSYLLVGLSRPTDEQR